LLVQVAAEKYLPPATALHGGVFYLKMSESMPPAWVVEYLLTGLGQRGWLAGVRAVLVGRPQAWDFAHPLLPAEQAAYRQQQRAAVVRAVRRYNPQVSIVQNMDFGHTNPQLILPSGRPARVLGSQQRVFFTY
jgi:muramoyltetrapeptide carboxypeptidase LdcA involved in peptidoglycan recycling